MWRLRCAWSALRQVAGEIEDDTPAIGEALVLARAASTGCGAAVIAQSASARFSGFLGSGFFGLTGLRSTSLGFSVCGGGGTEGDSTTDRIFNFGEQRSIDLLCRRGLRLLHDGFDRLRRRLGLLLLDRLFFALGRRDRFRDHHLRTDSNSFGGVSGETGNVANSIMTAAGGSPAVISGWGQFITAQAKPP